MVAAVVTIVVVGTVVATYVATMVIVVVTWVGVVVGAAIVVGLATGLTADVSTGLTVVTHTTIVLGRTMTDEGRVVVIATIYPQTSSPRVPDGRTTEEEVGAVVAIPEGKIPAAVTPFDRTIEVSCSAVSSVLPIEEDVAEVNVAEVPERTIESGAVNIDEVFEVNLIDLIVLSGGEVKLVGHLVGEEVGLLLSVAEGEESSTERGHDTHCNENEGK